MNEKKNNSKGHLLAIDTALTTTAVGYFVDGELLYEERLVHPAEDLEAAGPLMNQDKLRRKAITGFLAKHNVQIQDIDIIMSRGGLCAPVHTGVYRVNRDMRDVLLMCRDGIHACNLGPIIADELSEAINEWRLDNNVTSPYGACYAYIADPPMADDMLPECRLGGLPELPRRAFFHALNSRAAVKLYLSKIGHDTDDVTVIVAHLGNGISVSLHRNGSVIDTNNGLGGDGPFTPNRAGTCPAFQLVEMCFSGKYTEKDIKKLLVGGGGAVAYFGTNDIAEIARRGKEGDKECKLFTDAFCLNIAKYIAQAAATAEGKVDAVILTGPGAQNKTICEGIRKRVAFVAPVEIFAGGHELASLAENGFAVLSGKAKIHKYDKNAIIQD